ncbi:MAG TPA: tRNA uridine-5-carboxymethylaminomethyl(34) synthesis GTPase MnmE [Elusimicrobiota bacterium]|nr:tRNA uridine-5-carboxymethylaminomethyl(34) synthesis GTPase MnmE [Elusimicrobiota bacterium]
MAKSREIETIAAAATPAGGALATLRVSGPDALSVGLSFLRPRNASGKLLPRQATLCEAGAAERPIDEVVAVFYPGPNSATGEDLVEISCHGSPYVIKKILQAALVGGARLAEPGEFTQRAFLHGRMDLSQAEAVADLIRARSEGAHRAALAQLQGGLAAAIEKIREPLLDALVRIEANLDHPEEDIPSLSAGELKAALSHPAELIAKLAQSYERGRLASEGARVCLVGRPNAGKSSLLNALLGRERAIVCAAPGTTRDTLEEEAVISGTASVLIDTAGLRDEAALDPAEAAGMERTRAALASSDLVLLVIDGSRPPTPDDERVHREILAAAAKDGRPALSILNKTDIAARDWRGGTQDVMTSALRQEGIADLAKLIARHLGAREADAQQVTVTSLRHHEALTSAGEEIDRAQEAPKKWPGEWEDRAAFHLRQSLRALGSITGEDAPDEVLARVFSRFCVGK